MRRRLVSRARYDALAADRARIIGQRDEALRAAAAHENATRTMARQNVLLSEQVAERDARIRDLTARLADRSEPADVTALKQQLADLEQANARLQDRLDQALGLDDPAVAAGAQWQSRRQRKMPLDPS